MKKSIVVFAVAAACAGSAAAGPLECQNELGYQAWYNGGQLWNGGSKAWAVTRDNFDSFKSNNTVAACVIPKNGKKQSTLGTVDTLTGMSDMTTDMCTVFTSLASASDKVASGKYTDAYTTLTNLSAKLDTMASQAKPSLVAPGYGAVKTAISNAITQCSVFP